MLIAKCTECKRLVESRLMVDSDDLGRPVCVSCESDNIMKMLAHLDGPDFMAAFEEMPRL